ncbi:MAG: SDR family oxidoreductase [Anaerolineae bacterium]|nr:SDR family oxidoreductase [Anaerolineae bacterium]
MTDMNGKVAIVTGGSAGIGLATVRRFVERGANVVIADIDAPSGEEAVASLPEGQALFVHTDVSREEDVKEMVRKTVEQFGRLDYAVNNAGVGGAAATTADYTLDDWRRVIDINLTGVWLCMKYELQAMLESGGGAIVNVSSILSTVGFATAPAYVASKHGVNGLTKTAAVEYATQGIRVNTVSPGFVYTAMLEKAGMAEGTELYEQIAELHPMHRMGTPEEAANLIVWTCSDEASFVTGATLLVDGGYTAR